MIKSAAVCHAFWHVIARTRHTATWHRVYGSPASVSRSVLKACVRCNRFALPHCCSNPFFFSQNILVCNSTLSYRLLPVSLLFDKCCVLWICFANGFAFDGLLVTFISPSFRKNETKRIKSKEMRGLMLSNWG